MIELILWEIPPALRRWETEKDKQKTYAKNQRTGRENSMDYIEQ